MLEGFQEGFKFRDVVGGLIKGKVGGVQLDFFVVVANKGSAAVLLLVTATIKEIGGI